MNNISNPALLLDTEREQQSALDCAVASIASEFGVRGGLQQCEECREWVVDNNLEYICQASLISAQAGSPPSVHFTVKTRYPYYVCPEGCSKQQKYVDGGEHEHQLCPVHIQAVYQLHGSDLTTMKKGFTLTCPDCGFISPILDTPGDVLQQVEQHLKLDISAAAAAGLPAQLVRPGADVQSGIQSAATAAAAAAMSGLGSCLCLQACHQKGMYSHLAAYGAAGSTSGPHHSTMTAAAAGAPVPPEQYANHLLARIAVCAAVHLTPATAGPKTAGNVGSPAASAAAAMGAGADPITAVSQAVPVPAAVGSSSDRDSRSKLLPWRDWALQCLTNQQLLLLANWARPRLPSTAKAAKISLLDRVLSAPLRVHSVVPAATFESGLVCEKLVAILKRLRQRHARKAAVQQQQQGSPAATAAGASSRYAAAGGSGSAIAGTLTAHQLLEEMLSQDCVFKHQPAQQRVQHFLQQIAVDSTDDLSAAMNSKAVNAAHVVICATCGKGTRDRHLNRCNNCVVCFCRTCAAAVDRDSGTDAAPAAAAESGDGDGEGFICLWCRSYDSRLGITQAVHKSRSSRGHNRNSSKSAAAAAAASDRRNSSGRAKPHGLQQGQQLAAPTAAAAAAVPQVRLGHPVPSSGEKGNCSNTFVSSGCSISEARLKSIAAEFCRVTSHQLTQQQMSTLASFSNRHPWQCLVPAQHRIPPGWLEIKVERSKDVIGHHGCDSYYMPPEGWPSLGFSRLSLRSGPDIARYLAAQQQQAKTLSDGAQSDSDQPDRAQSALLDQTQPQPAQPAQAQLDRTQPAQPAQPVQAQPDPAHPDHAQLYPQHQLQAAADTDNPARNLQQQQHHQPWRKQAGGGAAAAAAGGTPWQQPAHAPVCRGEESPCQQTALQQQQQQQSSQVTAEQTPFAHFSQQQAHVKKENVVSDQLTPGCIVINLCSSDDDPREPPQKHHRQQLEQQQQQEHRRQQVTQQQHRRQKVTQQQQQQREHQATSSQNSDQYFRQPIVSSQAAFNPDDIEGTGSAKQCTQQQQQQVLPSQIPDRSDEHSPRQQRTKRCAQMHAGLASKRHCLTASDSSAACQAIHIKQESTLQDTPKIQPLKQQQQQQQLPQNKQRESQQQLQQLRRAQGLQTDGQQRQQQEQQLRHPSLGAEQHQQGARVLAQHAPQQGYGNAAQLQQQRLLTMQQDIDAGIIQLMSGANLDTAAHMVLQAMQMKKLHLANRSAHIQQAAASFPSAAASPAAAVDSVDSDGGLSSSNSSDAATALEVLLQITQLLLEVQADRSKDLLLQCLGSTCLAPERSDRPAGGAADPKTVLDLLTDAWVQEVKLTGCLVDQAAAAVGAVARLDPGHVATSAIGSVGGATAHRFIAGLCFMVLRLMTCAVTAEMAADGDTAVVDGCARQQIEDMVQQLTQGTSLLLQSHAAAATGVGGAAAGGGSTAAAKAVLPAAWNTQAGLWRLQVWCSLQKVQNHTGSTAAAAALSDVCKHIRCQLQEMRQYLLS